MCEEFLVVVGATTTIFTAADINEAAVIMEHRIASFLNQFHRSPSSLNILLICKSYEQSIIK